MTRDFREFLQSLNNNQVRYLVVGGYAVAFHGYPRYTRVIDIWIELSDENAQRMVAALDEFGFASLELKVSDFLEPGQAIQLGYPPNRIAILTSISGVDFAGSYANRVVETLEGDIEVSFIDLPGLKQNKRAAGRLQDLADIENLQP